MDLESIDPDFIWRDFASAMWLLQTRMSEFLAWYMFTQFHASSPMMGWPCSFNLRDSSVSEHEKLTMKQHTIQRTVYFISSGGSESDRYEVKQLRAHADDTVFGVVRERTGHNRQICSTCCGSSVLSVMVLSII